MFDDMESLRREIWGDPPMVDLYEELEKAKFYLNGKTAIRHRFLVVDEYDASFNWKYNSDFERKKSQAEGYLEQEEWWKYVSSHEEDFWPIVLNEIKDSAPREKWGQLVRDAWCLSNAMWMNIEKWKQVLLYEERPVGLMTQDETTYLASKPDPLTIFRGCLPEYVEGLSWTLLQEVAEYFKHKAGPRGVVFRGIVKKEHVIAFLKPNGEEFEIIVFPDNVANKEIV